MFPYTEKATEWTTRSLIFGTNKRFFFSPKHPSWHWGAPGLLLYGFRGFLSRGTRREVAHLHLVPRVRMIVAIPLLPLYGLVPYTEKTLNIPFTLVCMVLQALTCAIICPGFLSQQHGASSACRWSRRPSGMECTCEYIE